MTALGQELADALGDLRDRHEIGDLLMRYATALDTRDWALLENVFTPDAVADYGELGDGVHHGVEAIVQACRSALIGLDATQHIITNVTVEVTGDEARAACYLHAQHVLDRPDGAAMFTVGGIYRDRLRRTPGGWRIVHRQLRPMWTSGAAGLFAVPTEREGFEPPGHA